MPPQPTRESCDKENCASNEQQAYRVLQLWRKDPHGRFDQRSSNFDRVRTTLEHMIGRILRHAEQTAFHEFWCDGVEIIEHEEEPERFQFAGACIISDKRASTMWLAPFELEVEYRSNKEWPSAASMRIGHSHSADIFDRALPCNRAHRLHALSHWISGNRPADHQGWGMLVSLNPYPQSA